MSDTKTDWTTVPGLKELERYVSLVAAGASPVGLGRIARDAIPQLVERIGQLGRALGRHKTEPDPNDPDGWILRSALNHWSERAIKAEANIKRAERLLETIGCDCENHGDFDCNQCQREAQLKGTGDD